MTARERVERDTQILRERLCGISEPEVARRFEVSPRRVRRIVAAHREFKPAFPDLDADEIVLETLDGYQAAVEELALLAQDTAHDGLATSNRALVF